MSRVYCKNCKFDKSIIETKRSKNGLQTTYYCDPKGISRYGEITEVEKKKLLVSIEQNKNEACEYYKPKWYLRLFGFLKQ